MDDDYAVIIYFSEGKWLSQNKVLKRLYDLQSEIKSFIETKGKFGVEPED